MQKTHEEDLRYVVSNASVNDVGEMCLQIILCLLIWTLQRDIRSVCCDKCGSKVDTIVASSQVGGRALRSGGGL